MTETKVLKELKQLTVDVPLFKTKEDAIQAYIEKLKGTWQTAYKALTDEKGTKEQFFAGLKTFGTHGDYKDPKKLKALLDTMSKMLFTYAEERLTVLTKELADLHPETLPTRNLTEADERRDAKIYALKSEIQNFERIKAEAQKINSVQAKR